MDKLKKVTLRLNEEELEKLKVYSKNSGMSINSFIRYIVNNNINFIQEKLALEKELKDVYKELAYQLRTFGNIMNQVNKNFYSGEKVKIEEIEKRLDEIWQFIK